MNKKVLLAIAAVCFSGAAFAAGAGGGVLAAPELPEPGDAAAGKKLSASCAACHGADGNSAAPTFPKLAGQGEKYLIKQMNDIQSGKRSVPTMMGQLDTLNDKQIKDIAAYYASQETTLGQAKKDLVRQGEEIYRAGIGSRAIPACTGCHSPTGQGMAGAGFPALGGQHADYTVAQLKSFRAAADCEKAAARNDIAAKDANCSAAGRSNDGDEAKTMRTIAFRMSDKEIEAVASYISGLHK